MSSSVFAQSIPVLISAMVTRRNDDEDDFGIAAPVIKNTFIEVPFADTAFQEASSVRRSASAPPLWRKRGGLEPQASDDEICAQLGTDSAASTSAADHTDQCADDYADTDDDGGQLHRPNVETVPERRALSTNANLFVQMAPCWSPASAGHGCGSCWSPEPPGYAQLSTDAKHSFAAVVAAGLGALRASDLVERSEVVESACGWTLSCTARSEGLGAIGKSQAIIEAVQSAVLQAAEVSSNTYVVGYDATPFVPIFDEPGAVGFSAQLAIVRDEKKACWDFLRSGGCGRGYACRWQHPVEQVVLQVNVNL